MDKRFARNARIAWRLIEAEAVLLDREEGELLRLNPVGTEIWRGLDGPRTVGELVELIRETFEVERACAEKDVLRFLGQLIRREMVDETPENGAGA